MYMCFAFRSTGMWLLALAALTAAASRRRVWQPVFAVYGKPVFAVDGIAGERGGSFSVPRLTKTGKTFGVNVPAVSF